MTTSPTRIGVVGLGARSVIATHVHAPDGVVVGGYDPLPSSCERSHTWLGDVPTVTRLHELLALDIDAAIVTSPDDTHAELATSLLSKGIAVFLEKPMAITLADADRILASAQESGSRLYVGHNMRHMSVVRILKQIVDSGQIGQVKTIWCRHFVGNGGDYYFKDWHADRTHTTGLLLQKAAHDIDIIHYLAGSYTRQVVGMGGLMIYGDIQDRRDRTGEIMLDWLSHDNWPPATLTGLNPVVDVEDLSMVLMKLESGIFASYQQCHFTPDYWRNYTVIGSEGRAENFGDTDGGVVRVWNHRTDYDPDGDITYRISGDAKGHDDADISMIAEFLRFVREGTPTQTSPISAREAVATGYLATDSLRSGSRPLAVPPPDPEAVAYFSANQTSRPRKA